jgi:hypothetical protein
MSQERNKENFSMKTICLIVIMLCLTCAACTLQAQEVKRFAFAGAGYFDGAQVKGLAGFFTELGKDTGIFNVTEATFGLVPKGQGNVSIGKKDLQADFSSGIAYQIFNYKSYRLFALGEPGLQQTGTSSAAMFKAGGGVHKQFNQTWGLAVFGTWKYSEVDFKYQWRVNPAIAITARF